MWRMGVWSHDSGHLLLDVLCHSGVCADAVLLHEGDEVTLRQPRGRLRPALHMRRVMKVMAPRLSKLTPGCNREQDQAPVTKTAARP